MEDLVILSVWIVGVILSFAIGVFAGWRCGVGDKCRL